MKKIMYGVFKGEELLDHLIYPTETICMAQGLQFFQDQQRYSKFKLISYPTNWHQLKQQGYSYRPILVIIETMSIVP